MIVYGDILFILNMIIDYLLLSAVLAVMRSESGILRQIFAAAVGGLSAFYIFYESGSAITDILYRIITSFIMLGVLFGLGNFRKLIRGFIYYIGFSFLLGGIAELTASQLTLPMLAVNGGYFYIGISPIMLIVLSVLFYLVLRLITRIRKNRSSVETCKIEITLKNKSECFDALIDSGNTICDILSDSEILIVSERVIKALCGEGLTEYLKKEENKNRCRIIPTETVKGRAVLYALRCDGARLFVEKKDIKLNRPIAALSESLDEDYDVIISKGIIDNENF